MSVKCFNFIFIGVLQTGIVLSIFVGTLKLLRACLHGGGGPRIVEAWSKPSHD